jgi:type IV pilus assembly protein PilC
VPKFEQIFADMLGGKPLPLLTQIVISSSRFVQHQFILIGVAVGALVFGLKFMAASPKGAIALDHFMLKAPLFGDLTRKNGISRFTRTLGTLVTSGVPILQALNITKETAGNAIISNAISKIHDAVKEGESIVRPMEASGVFPAMVISMVDVGEETGQLPEMLLKVADLYDDEVDSAVAGLTSLMEPIMIVFLAVVVGSIVIALFLPLISIISGMQQ